MTDRTRSNPVNRKRWLVLVSPLGVVALVDIVGRVTGIWLGSWAWLPMALVYWVLLALLIRWGARPGQVRGWLGPSRGTLVWPALGLVIAAFTFLTVFMSNWRLLAPIEIWLPWLVFAAINPLLEEGYWRGLLLDSTSNWPVWLSILVTNLLFLLSHPLIWGVYSEANRSPGVTITFILGVAYAAMYLKTGSLRWPIISHALADLFVLSVPAFLNLYVPGN